MIRRGLLVLGLAVLFVLVAGPLAYGDYLGSDPFGSGVTSPGTGGLADKYPLSAYGLDYHVDADLLDGPEAWAQAVTQWLAATIAFATQLVAKFAIDVFGWAYSLNLLSGPGSALRPVADAIANFHDHILGEAWQKAAICIAGLWALLRLARQEYTKMIWGLGMTLAIAVTAMFFIYKPVQTIGEATQITNDMSGAFLSATTKGSVSNPNEARDAATDFMFRTVVFMPWVVAEFGGTRHCVDTSRTNQDGFPTPVKPNDPRRDVCRDHIDRDRNGYGGYADRFLAQPMGSKERELEYEALKRGEIPITVPANPNMPRNPRSAPPPPGVNAAAVQRQFAGYQVDKNDSPAADLQQGGGSLQRLGVVLLTTFMVTGFVALFGRLALLLVVVQMAVLALVMFAPVMLIAGLTGTEKGHAVFRWWLSRIGIAVFVKAVYSLVIACLLVVSMATMTATAVLGVLGAMALNGFFYWGLYIKRKDITKWMGNQSGAAMEKRMTRKTYSNVQKGGAYVMTPLAAVAGTAVGRLTKKDDGKDDKPPDPPTTVSAPPEAPPVSKPQPPSPPKPPEPGKPPVPEPQPTK